MKNLTTTLIALSLGLIANSQTRPQLSMYMFNYPAVNPAATGIEDYGNIQGGLRRQWAGINGAPTTYWMNGNMPFTTKAEDNEKKETIKTVITKGHGIGFNLYHDAAGPYSQVNLNVGYAYHLPLTEELALSAGFSGGIRHMRYDMSKNIYPDQGLDPSVGNEASNMRKKISPDLNAGLLLNGKDFFAGLSVLQVIPSKFVNTEEENTRYRREFIGSAGYAFRFNENETSLWLSSLVMSDFLNPTRVDLTAKFKYRELVWVAANWRLKDALGAGLGVQINKKMSIAYMYDMGINNHFSSYTQGSHEFGIGFKFLKNNQAGISRMGW